MVYSGDAGGQGSAAPYSMEALEGLIRDTELTIQTMAKPAQRDLGSQLDELKQKFEETEKIQDSRERNIQLRILNASFESLRSEVQEEERDLANAVFGLNVIINSMGAEYAALENPSTEEQKLVSDAEAALATAQQQLEGAALKWNIFGSKDRAIARAKEAIKNAEQGIEDARSEAKRRARRRLQSRNMEDSLQDFQYKVEQTISIMEKRRDDIKQQLAAVQTRKGEAFRIKEEAAKALEALDRELQEKEAELEREEGLLNTFLNGTSEHAQQDEKISNLRAEVEDLRGRRNNALILFQSKEKFAAELEIHERSHMKLRDNHTMWITALRSDTQERVTTFKSRLEAMKAMSDQDIAKQLDTVGSTIDQANAVYMAAAGAASDEVRMEKIENQPERVAAIAKAQAAQAEAIQRIRLREQEAINDFKKRYGIDPTETSFFHYGDKAA
jgi:hypothetical protein